jgi:hypothetical protein
VNDFTYDEFPFGPDLPLHELFDASNECVHGNLPFDPRLDCSCWNIRRVPSRRSWGARRYPEQTRLEAVAMYTAGASMRTVAAQFGVSSRTVRQWVAAAGGEMRPPGNPNLRRAA